MEDTLGGEEVDTDGNPQLVLILVLMEDTLGECVDGGMLHNKSLNPCSNGRYSRRVLSPRDIVCR